MENGKTNPIVESVISNVAIGAADPMSGDRSTRPELGRIQVSFVEYEKRHGNIISTLSRFYPGSYERHSWRSHFS